MAITIYSEPAIEPIAVAEIKADLRIDADLTEHDFLISALIVAARRWLESKMRRALITQTIDLTLDAWPRATILEIPRPPLQSISSITYYDDNDTAAVMAAGEYFTDTASTPGRVVLRNGSTWPGGSLRVANGIVIRYVAGYGDSAADVPATFIQAIRLLVGHWYENPSAVAGTGAQPKEIPLGVNALLWPDRVMGF